MIIRNMSALGRLIRERRKAVGMTGEELARMAGVSRRLLVEVERGRRANVGAAALLRLLELLGLTVEVQPRGSAGRV